MGTEDVKVTAMNIHRIHKWRPTWVDWRPDMTSRRFRIHTQYFRVGKEKMNDRRAENYIPGSSLSWRRSSVLKK